jgi:hypothetical protein
MAAVSFSAFDASRIANVVKRVERYAGTTANGEPVPWNDAGNETLYGAVAADWTSGNTISLTPCDCEGTATGESDVTVNCQSCNLALATIAGNDSTAVSCKIAAGTLLTYALDAGGHATLVGQLPTQFVWDYRYDAQYHVFQVKVAFLFGTAVSTVSSWHDVRACTQVTAITAWQVDGTSGEIQKKTQAFYAPEVGSESAWTKIDDTTESDTTPCS